MQTTADPPSSFAIIPSIPEGIPGSLPAYFESLSWSRNRRFGISRDDSTKNGAELSFSQQKLTEIDKNQQPRHPPFRYEYQEPHSPLFKAHGCYEIVHFVPSGKTLTKTRENRDLLHEIEAKCVKIAGGSL